MSTANWQNLADMFFTQAERLSDQPFLWEKHDGAYRAISWRDAAERAIAIARGLSARGIKAGDRVILVSENRADWLICDIAIMSIGAISVPAYITNTVEDHVHVMSDSGAHGVIVSSARLAERVIPAAAQSAGSIDFVACMETQPSSKPEGTPSVISIDDLIAEGARHDSDPRTLASTWQRTDTACIIYTSGTGGLPKGVMLHHGAILHNCAGCEDALRDLGLGDEVFLSFLPLSHSYEHTAGQFFPISIGAQIYYAEGIESLGSNMREARPTIMTAVPRLYETLHQRITRGIHKQGGMKERLFNKAYALGAQRYANTGSLSPLARLQDYVLDKLVRDKIRARFGGRLKALVSGGAPLNPDIGLFFTALGLRILQGYGQTESAPVISVNRASNPKMHSVGPIFIDTEVRIADDGEILCRGELVMQGYWNNAEATRAVISEDGWLHTGDIGHFDADNHLQITDRKKDIIVNSGGDNIAPQRVEGVLCLEPEIAQAMVYGDRRAHLVALIVPDEGADKDTISAAIDRANATLSNIEKVRRFVLSDEPFSIENAEMTPTMKVRRHILKERYGAVLEALYR